MKARIHLPAALALVAFGLPGQVIFRSEVNLVLFGVRVADRSNQDVGGLTGADFTVLEDGRPQAISVFVPEKQPMTLGVLVDTSGSMLAAGKFELAKRELAPLIAAGHPDNEIFFMPFGTEPGPMVELSAGQGLPAAIEATQARRSGTALYDAIAVALCRLRAARHQRRALLVITDGADQHSRLSSDEVVRMLQRSPVQVFMIGYFSEAEHQVFDFKEPRATLVSGHDIENPLVVFERFAKETGAEPFFPNSPGEFQRAVAAVARNLATQYTLGYYAGESGKEFRRLQVKVNRRGVKVSTREGFAAGDSANAPVAPPACAIVPGEHPYPFEHHTSNAGGRLVYHDDFRDDASGWPSNGGTYLPFGHRAKPLAFHRGYSKDGYTLSREGTPGPTIDATIAAYGLWWSDFRATLEVATGKSAAPAGLVFRLNDRGHYEFVVVPRGDTSLDYRVVRREHGSGNATALTQWERVTGLASADTRRITAECRAGTCDFFIGGQKVNSVDDSAFPDGVAGMVLAGTGRAVFRDLLIEELGP